MHQESWFGPQQTEQNSTKANLLCFTTCNCLFMFRSCEIVRFVFFDCNKTNILLVLLLAFAPLDIDYNCTDEIGLEYLRLVYKLRLQIAFAFFAHTIVVKRWAS